MTIFKISVRIFHSRIFPPVYPQHPDPKLMQINMTGFLNGRNAREFMGELWELLVSAQENISGIPEVFLEQKKEEIKKRQVCLSLLWMEYIFYESSGNVYDISFWSSRSL